ncbi:MAG: hypothetical protein HQL78_11885 [Magnetococcales bacterium]|nr:hypothetical protein [Magnetococcales bacterium]
MLNYMFFVNTIITSFFVFLGSAFGNNAENNIYVHRAPTFTISRPDNLLLTRLFLDYENDTDILAGMLGGMMETGGTPSQWMQVHEASLVLEKKSFYLMQLGRIYHNTIWEYYASNLYHHCKELKEAASRHDGKESILLVAILVGHIGQIQSANPWWLREYLQKKMQILESGIVNFDKETTRNAAEDIHAASTKILLSASVAPEEYIHTQWQRNISQINSLGDSILDEVNRGVWEKVQEKFALIKHILTRWFDSFRTVTNDQ